MTIKTKISNLIASFKDAVATYTEKKTELQESKKYSSDFIAAEISKLDVAMNAVVADANSKLQAIIQEAIDEIKGKKSGGSDFESKLSNALTFINTLGDRLKDEIAFALVQPFFGDYQTMHRLSLVLAGKQGIPATRFAVSGYDTAISALKHIQKKYGSVFNTLQTGGGVGYATVHQYLYSDIDEFDKGMVRLNEFMSASADDAERLIEKHQRSLFGLDKNTVSPADPDDVQGAQADNFNKLPDDQVHAEYKGLTFREIMQKYST